MAEAESRKYSEADNIWITSKTRMHAEIRYKKYSKTSHLLLSYYALFLIFLSIFSDSITASLPLPQINIALSAAILGVSLVIHGFKFGETAQSHRECYLRLQRLIALVKDDRELVAQYHEIIAGYPNHSASDYDDLILDRTLVKKESIRNSKGSVHWTKYMLARKIIRSLSYWVLVLGLALLPALFLFYPVIE